MSNGGTTIENNNNKLTKPNALPQSEEVPCTATSNGNGTSRPTGDQVSYHHDSVIVNGDLILVNDFSALSYSDTGSVASNDSGRIKSGISTPLRIKRARSVDILKEKAVDILQTELQKAYQELQIKDERCQELSTVRNKLESEIEELTASLFEEAHKMVREANERRHSAEKKLNEAQGNIEALQAEVQALKSLVLTSTPSHPNPEKHPQLIKKKKEVSFNKLKKVKSLNNKSSVSCVALEGKEIDPVLMSEVSSWYASAIKRDESTSTKVEPECLMKRINKEDIDLCLAFYNQDLRPIVNKCVRDNSLEIEPISIHNNKRTCSLSKLETVCKYKIRLTADGEWFPISQACRKRITSVCDFLTYVRYAENGLIKHSKEQVYWQIITHRREMAVSRLGFYAVE